MTFTDKNVAKLTAKYSGNQNTVTFSGVTTDANLTPENAKEQIDKVLAIVGRSCVTTGMYIDFRKVATE